MKKYIYCCIALISILVVPAFSANENQIKTLEEMTGLVAKAELSEILQEVGKKKWDFPVIYSQWYVETQASEDSKPLYLAERNLGKALAVRLEGWAADMIATKTQNENREFAQQLISLADWVSQSVGYGNLILENRCRDIASVGVGRLIADMNEPLDESGVLLTNLELKLNSVPIRASILNVEMGSNMFFLNIAKEEGGQNDLKTKWWIGSLLSNRDRIPRLKEALAGTSSNMFTANVQYAKDRGLNTKDYSGLMQKIDFFRDNDMSTIKLPFTTLKLWDVKFHQKFIISFGSPNLMNLKPLFIYRRKVGKFPEKSNNESLETAFRKAWKEKDQSTHYFGCYRTYMQIKGNDFVDWETREKLVKKESEIRREKRKKESITIQELDVR